MRENTRHQQWVLPGICGVLLILVVIQLLPLLDVARYIVPSADDFSYGRLAYQSWQRGHSAWGLLLAGARTVKQYYFGWQGSYAGMFLMAIQPGIFGFSRYGLTTYILTAGLLGGLFYFAHRLFHTAFGAGRREAAAMGGLWSLLCIQQMPGPTDGLFWFNGGVYYTFLFGVELVMLGLLLAYLRQTGKRRRFWSLGCAAVLAFVLGGANYVTGFSCILLLGTGTFLLLATRDRRWRAMLLPLVVLTAGYLVSALAPGNQVRASGLAGMGAVETILQVHLVALELMGRWSSWTLLGAVVLATPILWYAAGRSQHAFRLPLLVMALSFELFAGQMCPGLYAMGRVSEDRILNVLYFSFVLFLFFCQFYTLGWFRRWRAQRGAVLGSLGALVPGLLAAALLFGCLTVGENPRWISLRAVDVLEGGAGPQYLAESLTREKMLQDPSLRAVYLPEYGVKPDLIYHNDAEEDITCWINEAMRLYYGKDLVQRVKR